MKKVCLALLILTWCFDSAYAHNDSAAMANADTSNFSTNQREGWRLYNSYVSVFESDSVLLEVTIQHLNSINWDEEQYLGKITNPELWPSKSQTLFFNLINDYFFLKVDNEGKCYLKYLKGSKPSGNSVVIPVRVTFKK